MISVILSRVVILLFGTLYPAYCSYKAVKTKNVKEYVRWMMYWIVFAIFTCAETFADIFISWLPFYYEIKIFFVIWLMLPATRGATILYKKFIHPQLSKREEEIDKCIAKASDQGYSTLLNLGSKSFNFAASIVLATAIKGQNTLSEQLKKSYSLNDLSKDETDGAYQAIGHHHNINNEDDDGMDDEERLPTSGSDNDMPEDAPLLQPEHDIESPRRSKRQPSTKTQIRVKAKNIDLDPLLEHEEVAGFKVQTKKIHSKKVTYDHNEIYHVATLPRQTRQSRPAINTKD